MMPLHRLAHEIGADQRVDRQALGRRQDPAIGRQDDAGEVVRGVQDARASGPEERVLHLPGDALHAAREHRHGDRLPPFFAEAEVIDRGFT
jgi:hypothetical protein